MATQELKRGGGVFLLQEPNMGIYLKIFKNTILPFLSGTVLTWLLLLVAPSISSVGWLCCSCWVRLGSSLRGKIFSKSSLESRMPEI